MLGRRGAFINCRALWVKSLAVSASWYWYLRRVWALRVVCAAAFLFICWKIFALISQTVSVNTVLV